MDKINSPILTISGINYHMKAMIIAEICDFNRFKFPDKILAYAGFSPSTYQSGQQWYLPPYRKAEFQTSTLCVIQRSQVTGIQCMLNTLGKETNRRQAFQCCHISCCQKAGSSDLASRKTNQQYIKAA